MTQSRFLGLGNLEMVIPSSVLLRFRQTFLRSIGEIQTHTFQLPDSSHRCFKRNSVSWSRYQTEHGPVNISQHHNRLRRIRDQSNVYQNEASTELRSRQSGNPSAKPDALFHESSSINAEICDASKRQLCFPARAYHRHHRSTFDSSAFPSSPSHRCH